MDLAAVLAWAAARAPVGWRGFFGRSGAAATLGSGVSSAASSAVVGVRFGAPARDRLHLVSGFRIKRGHCGSSWLRRSGGLRLLPFVVRGASHRR
jgi:hypothetical protein